MAITATASHSTRNLSVSFHKYGDLCSGCDGVEFAKRRRRDVRDIVEEERGTKLYRSRAACHVANNFTGRFVWQLPFARNLNGAARHHILDRLPD